MLMPPDSIIAAVAVTAIVAIIAGCLHSMLKMYMQRGGGAAIPQAALKEIREGLGQLQQSVDAMAVEVERLSEGQRFTTRLLAEHAREVPLIRPAVREG
jgi:hypothetical protein